MPTDATSIGEIVNSSFELDQTQKDVLTCPALRTCFVGARQTGTTTVGVIDAVQYAKLTDVLYVSPSLRKASEALEMLLDTVSVDIRDEITQRTKTLIRFSWGNEIRFVSAHNLDLYRIDPEDVHAVCDGFAFFDDGVATQIIHEFPELLVTTTPRPDDLTTLEYANEDSTEVFSQSMDGIGRIKDEELKLFSETLSATQEVTEVEGKFVIDPADL